MLLQLTYHAFGSEELRAAIEGARRPGRQPSHQVDPNDSEAIRFLKGGVLYESNTRGEDVGPCLLSDSSSSDGPHSISSSLVKTQMFCMTCRTAKVTVGKQMKHSNMVKGRNHDQAFDETLEFVLAAGQPIRCSTMHASIASPAQPSVHPLLKLHKPACIHCCFQFQNNFFTSDTSIHRGNLNSSGDNSSKDAVLHGGDVLCTAMCACAAHSAKCTRSSLGTHILNLRLCQLSGLIALVRNI